MKKATFTLVLVSLFLFPLTINASEGIPLQKDVFLGAPILGPEDLPEEITFTLFDAQDALIPLGSQTFTRGQYTVDFEFSQSNGITGGNAARIKANFTQPLNLVDAFGEPLKPKALWSALEVAGAEVGPRTKVSDETMVQLLLNSNASMATYLTLAYEGDDNPLTTIYKSLPLSFPSADGSTTSLRNYFSVLPESRDLGLSNNWMDTGSGAYIFGNVGIGTTTPGSNLHVFVGNSGGTPYPNAAITFEDDVSAYFQFLSSSAGYNALLFGDPGSIEAGAIYYTHSVDSLDFRTNGTTPRMLIDSSGNVGIGTTNPTYRLCVNGTVRAKEIIVDTGWSDFVFEDDYRLPPLKEVEQFIKEKRHLPGIPTETEVKEKGVSVGDMSSKLLQKIEELTLYVIDLKKENGSLKAQLSAVQEQLLKSPH